MTSSSQRAVLGIDAAWTATQPSGVALAVEAESGWRLAAVEASYEGFTARANGSALSETRPGGSRPNAAELLAAAQTICGRRVDLVAIDMPMSRSPIAGRRPADRLISERYGGMDAATHSPGKDRPGAISDTLRAEFGAEGYALCTAPPAQGLIEVYPHPALIEFLKAERRLEYKAGKTGVYWPALALDERYLNLRAVWARIVAALERRIGGVAERLPRPDPQVRGWRLKAYEDKLDAVVCAAVAIACLDGQAAAHGDRDAAIWVPAPGAAERSRGQGP
jgi:predicted RNase H-like nuclease